MRPLLRLTAIFLLTLACSLPAAADEISSQLEKGTKLYQDGKLSQAISEIKFALARLKQKKAEALAAIFPKPPDGWSIEKSRSSKGGGAMMGGAISASQRYRDAGKGRVRMEVVTDSPLIQALSMMLSNPMFLQSGKAGKLVTMQGHKAVLKDQGNRAELQALIDNKVVVRVNAWRVNQAAAVVQDFAAKMDLSKLKELGQ
ncbi:MAG: hypothetical protein KQH53_08110 [Desulfarculaceae bacterium]|nr:hypothetical protein [Desulfarculaceae bacterium]